MAEDDDDLSERFMAGGCHALALHLHARTGWPMAVLWLCKGRREELAHVMLIDPDDADGDLSEATYLDVGGMRGLPEIMDDLQADEEEPRIELVGEKALRAMTSRRRAPHRKLPELGDELMQEAGNAADVVLAGLGSELVVPSP